MIDIKLLLFWPFFSQNILENLQHSECREGFLTKEFLMNGQESLHTKLVKMGDILENGRRPGWSGGEEEAQTARLVGPLGSPSHLLDV